MEQQIHYIAWK